MNGETTLRTALESVRPTVADPDWEDVLGRARRSRSFRRPAVLTAAAAAVALLVAVPALGIGGELRRLVVGGGPGLRLGTPLTRADGRHVGSFSIRASRLFVGPRGAVFRARGHGFPRRPFAWTLRLTTTADEVVLERDGAVVSVICRPCRAGLSSGAVRLTFRQFGSLFGGRGLVVAKAAGGEARGRIRLEPPRR